MTYLTNYVRRDSDPKVIESGRSSLGTSDRLARGLGWFSIALGVTELVAAERLTRALGMEGKENLVRAYGLREIGAGVLTLSIDKQFGLWNRLAGDGLDIATLLPALHDDNPKRGNAGLALAAVLGVTLLDAVAAGATKTRHARRGRWRDYRDRSGFPQGVEAAKGRARQSVSGPEEGRSAAAEVDGSAEVAEGATKS